MADKSSLFMTCSDEKKNGIFTLENDYRIVFWRWLLEGRVLGRADQYPAFGRKC
jgi:hypothetical protein